MSKVDMPKVYMNKLCMSKPYITKLSMVRPYIIFYQSLPNCIYTQTHHEADCLILAKPCGLKPYSTCMQMQAHFSTSPWRCHTGALVSA